MSGGRPSVYFHPQAELHAARDHWGCPAPTPAPFWTVPHSSPTVDRPNEMEMDSIYAHPPCHVGGGAMAHHVGAGTTPSPVLQPRGSVHARVAAAPLAGLTTAHDRPPPVSHPFLGRAGSHQSGGSQGGDALRCEVSESFPMDFAAPGYPTWEDMVSAGFIPRAHAALAAQDRWEPSEPTRVHPPFAVHDPPPIEPPPAHAAEDDDDVYTLVCEWTDEHGTCNMHVLGDRVWMSHHLSRRHNVVGHEKSQRACLWRGCADTMNKGSLARHVVSRHLRAGASCGFCSKVYSRADVARRHTKKCKVANGTTVQRDRVKW